VARVADTTGAGDAFAGALVALLASGAAPSDHTVLRMAATVAAHTVEDVGVEGVRRLTSGDVEARALG
jgi:sugar/nucleoside kinase (ribokinase family)